MNTVTAPESLLREDTVLLDQDDTDAAWLLAELTRRINNPGREIPHAGVMADIKVLIDSKRKRA